jgi:hypothetical protein
MVVNERFEHLVLERMFDLVALARDGYCPGALRGRVFFDDALDEVVFKVFCGCELVDASDGKSYGTPSPGPTSGSELRRISYLYIQVPMSRGY